MSGGRTPFTGASLRAQPASFRQTVEFVGFRVGAAEFSKREYRRIAPTCFPGTAKLVYL